MGEDQSDDQELDGPITLRILDGIAWDFAQAKWWRWWKTVRCGGLILSYCPRNPHGKPGNEERRWRINSDALTKLRSENFWKLWIAIINRPMRLQLIICHKKEFLSSLSSTKLVLIRNKCYQCKLVCTGTMNKWCKILTIKTLTEVDRT